MYYESYACEIQSDEIASVWADFYNDMEAFSNEDEQK